MARRQVSAYQTLDGRRVSYYKLIPMETYGSREMYLKALDERSNLPEGFQRATHSLVFQPKEKAAAKPYNMNCSLICLDQPSPLFGGMFTRNAFPGAPVIIGRERISGPQIRGILINNRISNVRAPNGVQDAETLTSRLAELLGCSSAEILPSSTGIIGWSLPLDEMMAGLPKLVDELRPDSLLPVAEAIMTTDTFPKIRHAELGSGRIVGIAKGAGMIEPHLATMLVFLLTDIAIDRDDLRDSLRSTVKETFNRLTIDGDQSTSDSVLLVSSGARDPVPANDFRKALYSVCRSLSEDIVRSGEGTQHVMEITLRGAFEEGFLLSAAKAVANSPLVKTAVFGDDPNVGRFIMALGDHFGREDRPLNPDDVTLSIGGTLVYGNGAFRLSEEKEEELVRYMADCRINPSEKGYPEHEKKVRIEFDIGEPGIEVTVLASDLSYDYVKENAEYRT